MPQTLNGFGTWYYGKNQIYLCWGTCRHCGAFARLRSYDTTSYVVALFVPLLPLKRIRVVDECGACKRHLAVPAKEWTKAKQGDLAQVAERFQQDPRDLEAVQALIASLVNYQDTAGFRQAAPQLRAAARHDAETLLAIGDAWRYFGDWGEAEAVYRDAVALDDSELPRERLAAALALQRKPAEARPLLAGALEQADPEKLPRLFLLVESCQAAGDHALALEVLQDMERAFPQLSDDAGFKKLRDVSTRLAGQDKPVKAHYFDPPAAEQESPLGGMVPRLIAPVLAVGIVSAIALSSAAIGNARTVYVVSGLPTPYAVQVQGQRVDLPPGGRVSVRLAEGAIAVEPLDGAPVPAGTCTIETPFWSRVFSSPAYVINPDEVALIHFQQVVYSKAGGGGTDVVHTGKLLHAFDSIDHPFTAFPQSIRTKAKRVTKRRIDLISVPAPQSVAIVHEELGADEAVAFVDRCLARGIDGQVMLQGLLRVVGPEAGLDYLQTRLALRPLRIEEHRLFQGLCEQLRPEVDLVARYRGIYDEAPDAASAYLLARVTLDRTAARALFDEATRGTGPGAAYGFHALAFDALVMGEFTDAIELSRKAQGLLAQAGFEQNERMGLLALERYDELLEAVTADRRRSPHDVDLAAQAVRLYTCMGQSEQVQAVADALAQAYADEPEGAATLRAYLGAQAAYAGGDLPAFQATMQQCEPGFAHYVAAIEAGDVETACRELTSLDLTIEQLLPYVVLAQAGDATAGDELERRAQSLLSGRPEERLAGEALLATSRPDPQPLLDLGLMPAQKRIVLVALGLRWPADQSRYFALARALNFERTFPYHLLGRVLGE